MVKVYAKRDMVYSFSQSLEPGNLIKCVITSDEIHIFQHTPENKYMSKKQIAYLTYIFKKGPNLEPENLSHKSEPADSILLVKESFYQILPRPA
jgi:hypothetical protein